MNSGKCQDPVVGQYTYSSIAYSIGGQDSVLFVDTQKVSPVKTSAYHVKRRAAAARAAVPLEAVRVIWNNNNEHGPLIAYCDQ